MLNLMGVLNATAANVSCTCNCKRYTSLQSMEISEYALCFSDFCPLLFRLRGRSLFFGGGNCHGKFSRISLGRHERLSRGRRARM